MKKCGKCNANVTNETSVCPRCGNDNFGSSGDVDPARAIPKTAGKNGGRLEVAPKPSHRDQNRIVAALIAGVLGVSYSILELLLVEEVIAWNENMAWLFLLMITPCALISIKFKSPELLTALFGVLVLGDAYFVALEINENWYVEAVDKLLYPEEFPYVHSILVLVASLLLAYFTLKKSAPVDVADDQVQHQQTPDSAKFSLFAFRGRIKRGTYWSILVPLFLISFALQVAIAASAETLDGSLLAVLAMIYFIPATWVTLATYVKRWHDLDRSGWMSLTMFIPVIGLLVIVYLGFAPGTAGENRFGQQPGS